MRKLLALLVLAAVVPTSPALAWWDYARWGMTEQQLVTASKGAATPCTQNSTGPCASLLNPANMQPVHVPKLAIQSLMVAGEPASVSFVFDDAGKLRMTLLNFKQTHFRKITDMLIGTYGQPVDRREGAYPSRTWRDAAKGTLIEALEVVGTVRVTYTPIVKGL